MDEKRLGRIDDWIDGAGIQYLLEKKIDELERKLDIAVKALAHIGATEVVCAICSDPEQSLSRHYEDLANNALAEIKGP